jgi:hypothetical protein
VTRLHREPGAPVSDQYGNEPWPGDPNRRIDVSESAIILNAGAARGGSSAGGLVNNGGPISLTDSRAVCNSALASRLDYAVAAGVVFGVRSRVDVVRTPMVGKDLDDAYHYSIFGRGTPITYVDSPYRVVPSDEECRAEPPGVPSGNPTSTSQPTTSRPVAVTVTPVFTG